MQILPIGQQLSPAKSADVDCAQHHSPIQMLRALREAWSQHGVLVFRRQLLTEAALVQLLRSVWRARTHRAGGLGQQAASPR